MVCVTRNPVRNLNSLKIFAEVFSNLSLKVAGPLLRNLVNQGTEIIIANRTQTRIPSFELAIRIREDVLIV